MEKPFGDNSSPRNHVECRDTKDMEENLTLVDSSTTFKYNPGVFSCTVCSMQFNELEAFGQHVSAHDNYDLLSIQEQHALIDVFKQKDIKDKLDTLWNTKEVSDNDNSELSPPMESETKSYPGLAVEGSESCAKIHIVSRKMDKTELQSTSKYHVNTDNNHEGHTLGHSNSSEHVCIVCQKSFSDPSDLLRHTCMDSNVESHHSDVFNISFFNLEQHKLKHLSRLYKCEDCSESFKTDCNLQQHKLMHTGIKSYMCDVCSKSFSTSYLLKVHKLTPHYVGSHNCEECSAQFATSEDLKQHLEQVHLRKVCSGGECTESNSTNGRLLKDKVVSMGIKSHICNVCSRLFANSFDLKQHKKFHKRIVCSCEECGESFTTISLLQKHKLIHIDIKSHICDVCNLSFHSSNQLTIHKLLHYGATLHFCDRCSKMFATSEGVKRHKMIQHKYYHDYAQ